MFTFLIVHEWLTHIQKFELLSDIGIGTEEIYAESAAVGEIGKARVHGGEIFDRDKREIGNLKDRN